MGEEGVGEVRKTDARSVLFQREEIRESGFSSRLLRAATVH